MNASISDYIKSGLLYALPHHLISRTVYKLTRVESPIVPFAINAFSKAFKVDLGEAKYVDPKSYSTFNSFFTRELKNGLRPIASSKIISPVDGTISQFGKINDGLILQAKGIEYSVERLLGKTTAECAKYKNGQFITLYLSPRDYHRIHMPCSGKLTEQTHVPGRLFSVANHTVSTVKGIFARNERVIATFKTEIGELSMVLVGAINVAAIETVWDGLITPPKGKITSTKYYTSDDITLEKGEEMGRFNMGSTVILLLEEGSPEIKNSLQISQTVRLGEELSA